MAAETPVNIGVPASNGIIMPDWPAAPVWNIEPEQKEFQFAAAGEACTDDTGINFCAAGIPEPNAEECENWCTQKFTGLTFESGSFPHTPGCSIRYDVSEDDPAVLPRANCFWNTNTEASGDPPDGTTRRVCVLPHPLPSGRIYKPAVYQSDMWGGMGSRYDSDYLHAGFPVAGAGSFTPLIEEITLILRKPGVG